MTILIISHGHPLIRKGGGEIAAYNQFISLKKKYRDGEVIFLAHAEDQRLFKNSGAIIPYRANEYLFNSKFNGIYLINGDSAWVSNFDQFLKRLNPKIVHFHHYFKVGLEAIIAAKKFNDAKVFVTLHEYLAICQNDGQMVKGNGAICSESNITNCTLCSPNRVLSTSLMREINIKNTFSQVDKFFSPSRFLLEKYKSWGIPGDKIIELENGYPIRNSNERTKDQSVINFAFFGQFTPYKGVDLFCEAALIVKRKYGDKANFFVYGSRQQNINDEFSQRIQNIIDKCNGIIGFMGGYDDSIVVDLMKSVDWIVIPSKWWENSPVIIDEARAAGTPMIVANHGGLNEKVIEKGIGVGFVPGSIISLAEKMILVIENADKWNEYAEKITKPTDVDDIANKLIEHYEI